MVGDPRNDRNWGNDTKVLPHVFVDDNIVTVSNIRDFQYQGKKLGVKKYLTRSFKISDLEKVWFVVEPFNTKPFSDFIPTAHTYFVFDFKNSQPIAVSVESRREKDEGFNIINGMFNQYELIYIWGTEKDLTGRRVMYEDNKVYMYPLLINKEYANKLFVQLAKNTHELETKPRFYNTFTSNCTSELGKVVNEIKPGSVLFTLSWILPGLSVDHLYKLGFIPNDLSLEEEKNRYFISDLVKKYYSENDFSKKIRLQL